jgi:hypothetical protein
MTRLLSIIFHPFKAWEKRNRYLIDERLGDCRLVDVMRPQPWFRDY